jgi:tRNA dimethylallyltransferase
VTASSRPALLVIVGPTGSGKSAIAAQCALRRSGEIISADAFAVYRGLDIGTAKPSAAVRASVPHHLIDVAEPVETYSAGRWAGQARQIAEDVAARGKLPIVAGGSGFYVSALLDGLPPGELRDERLRGELSAWGRGREQQAHRVLAVNDPVAAARIDPANLRYTLRALEILLATGRRSSERRPSADGWADRFRVCMIGIETERADLYARIASRVRRMLDEGWDGEVRRLLEQGVPLTSHAFQAIGYREVAEWVLGRAGRTETQERIVTATRRFARRQRTWFARERRVRWLNPVEAVAAALREPGGADETETVE